MPEGFLLSQGDRDLMQGVIEAVRVAVLDTVGRPHGEYWDEVPAPDVYVAKSPSAGIPALTPGSPDKPGSVMCDIYRINPTGSTWEIRPIKDLSRRVYNLSGQTVSGNKWLVVVRDKGGYWHVVESGAGAGFWARLTGPVATTLATATTGGTIAAGTYWFYAEYVTANGSFSATSPASIETTGTTSTITITSPPAVTGATGYKVYASSSPNGPYYLQGGTNTIGVNLTLTSLTLSGTQPTAKFAYSWEEHEPKTGGGFQLKTNGLTGTTTVNPAYEVGGSKLVYNAAEALIIVWLRSGFNNTTSVGLEYLFEGGETDDEGVMSRLDCSGGNPLPYYKDLDLYNGRVRGVSSEHI